MTEVEQAMRGWKLSLEKYTAIRDFVHANFDRGDRLVLLCAAIALPTLTLWAQGYSTLPDGLSAALVMRVVLAVMAAVVLLQAFGLALVQRANWAASRGMLADQHKRIQKAPKPGARLQKGHHACACGSGKRYRDCCRPTHLAVVQGKAGAQRA